MKYRSGIHTTMKVTNNHPHTRPNGKEVFAKMCRLCQEMRYKRI